MCECVRRRTVHVTRGAPYWEHVQCSRYTRRSTCTRAYVTRYDRSRNVDRIIINDQYRYRRVCLPGVGE